MKPTVRTCAGLALACSLLSTANAAVPAAFAACAACHTSDAFIADPQKAVPAT